MPVNTTHPEYDLRISQWQRCRDVIDGSDAVKKKQTQYLPMLSGMDDTEYEAYKKRALFYGATGRTIQGLMGAVFRRDPVVEVPSRFVPYLQDITVDGLDHIELARRTVEEVLGVGRLGLLTDMPKKNASRAFVSLYTPQNILNWAIAVVDGQQKLMRVVLREEAQVPVHGDPYDSDMVVQYRVLVMEDGVYKQKLFEERKNDKGIEHALIEEIIPIRIGKTLDFIPFQFVGPFNLSCMPQKPPLLDLVDVNLSHYRTSADLEHGAHYTALPTAILAGFQSKDGPFKIGSGVAWSTENSDAKAWFLEYTGSGLSSLRELKKDKENMMAVLGARLLEEQKKAAEAAETKQLNRSGEEGSLTTIAGTCSQALENVLKWVLWWSGNQQDSEVSFRLNTDFISTQLSPQELVSLIQARQSGEISQETLLFNLKRGEILPPDRSIEQEQDLLQMEGGEFQ